MKIHFEGEKSIAICPNCKIIVTTTFTTRDVTAHTADWGRVLVKNVLVSVCDRCEHVIGIPQQSTPAIKKKLEQDKK